MPNFGCMLTEQKQCVFTTAEGIAFESFVAALVKVTTARLRTHNMGTGIKCRFSHTNEDWPVEVPSNYEQNTRHVSMLLVRKSSVLRSPDRNLILTRGGSKFTPTRAVG